MPGAYANVHIQLAVPKRSLLVPAGALLFQAPGPQIAIVNSQDRIELRPVSIGSDFGNTVEITSGITADDRVVANPPDYLVNSMPVAVQAASGQPQGNSPKTQASTKGQ
jgi:multidrug efflux pump subunit AcrA (membrane-fusion protein)